MLRWAAPRSVTRGNFALKHHPIGGAGVHHAAFLLMLIVVRRSIAGSPARGSADRPQLSSRQKDARKSPALR